LRELQNILVLVQIKDKNWTKYESNLSKIFSYIDTNIESSTAAYSGCPRTDDDDGSSFHRVRTPIDIAQEEVDDSRGDCDDEWKKKKKNHTCTSGRGGGDYDNDNARTKNEEPRGGGGSTRQGAAPFGEEEEDEGQCCLQRAQYATVPSAAENLLQVKGPREGKNNHLFHFPL
jgi:hypothetical protein